MSFFRENSGLLKLQFRGVLLSLHIDTLLSFKTFDVKKKSIVNFEVVNKV